MAFATPSFAAGFASPSGNIRCYLDIYSDAPFDEMDMVCLIFDADWDLPPDYGDDDPTCDLDSTRAMILPARGPATEQLICHGDVFWPAPLGAISYGSDWSLADFSCEMATTGVTCTNTTGNSFSVARGRRVLN